MSRRKKVSFGLFFPSLIPSTPAPRRLFYVTLYLAPTPTTRADLIYDPLNK